MKDMKLFFYSILILMGGAIFTAAAADDIKKIDADDFVTSASAKSLTGIETSRLALKETNSIAVQQFAEEVIVHHKAINRELKGLARDKNLSIAEDATLMGKVKKQILDMRNGTSFDIAYANNQVEAHKRIINLFERASISADPDIKTFANRALPKLEEHLRKAKQLAALTDEKNEIKKSEVESITEMETDGATTIPPRNLD